jgi:tetratricopeptide (TPR) repeat protein
VDEVLGTHKTYQAMERYDEALADLKRAIELDPATSGPSPNAARPTG